MTMTDRQATNSQLARAKFQINRQQVIGGSIMIVVGGGVALAGIGVACAALVSAYRDRIAQMDVPPTELARHHLNRVRQATAAGYAHYRNTQGQPIKSAVPVQASVKYETASAR